MSANKMKQALKIVQSAKPDKLDYTATQDYYSVMAMLKNLERKYKA